MSSARKTVFKVAGWFAIAALTFELAVNFGTPRFVVVVAALVSLFVGTSIGVVSTIATARRQWPIIERFINFESIEARLRELET